MNFDLVAHPSICRITGIHGRQSVAWHRPGFLAILWLLQLCTPLAAQQSGYFRYSSNGNSITITTYTGSESAIAIPSTIAGLPVTEIGPNAFGSRIMTSVSIPSSVLRIGRDAFSRCLRLKSASIPSNLTTIGDSAFNGCTALTGVTIPSSVSSIGESAFYGCAALTSITIPSDITSIGSYAFANCSNLASISVNSSNTQFSSSNGVLFNKTMTTLIQYPGGKSGSYTVPSTVTNIGIYAFLNCAWLANVTIPASVTTIGSPAFWGCSRLTAFSVATANTTFSASNGVMFNKAQTTLIRYPNNKNGEYVIPASVTNIENVAFDSSYGLTSVTIPVNATSIGSLAFYSCSGLKSATFEGKAPVNFNTDTFRYAAPGFTIRFYAGATGFTTPTWNGYPAVAIIQPEISLLQLPSGDLKIIFSGILQFSPNLSQGSWQDLVPAPVSPHLVTKENLSGSGYFRARSQE